MNVKLLLLNGIGERSKKDKKVFLWYVNFILLFYWVIKFLKKNFDFGLGFLINFGLGFLINISNFKKNYKNEDQFWLQTFNYIKFISKLSI